MRYNVGRLRVRREKMTDYQTIDMSAFDGPLDFAEYMEMRKSREPDPDQSIGILDTADAEGQGF
jgi:hypothetical protein